MGFDVLISLFRWKYVGQFNLIPLAMWTQIQSGFLTAQITRVGIELNYRFLSHILHWLYIYSRHLSPVSLAFGIISFIWSIVSIFYLISYVGLVMISYGICQSSSSYLFGYLVKYIGRVGCFIVASLLNYAMILLMFFWRMHDNQMLVLFIIVSIWGIADGIWQSQVFGKIYFLCVPCICVF